MDKIIEEAGAIHGFVVNAGRTKHKPALDFTTEEITQLWSINLFGSFYCARVAARAFIKLGVKGSIVFTASMASYRPNKRVPSAPYGASKAGVRNMTHTLAMEWAQYNIRVNSVSPGLVNTAMTYWVPQQPDWEQQLKYYGGMPRLAEVEELGGAYVYLLSDAASYTTSIDIPVNGVIGSKFVQLQIVSSSANGRYSLLDNSNSARKLARTLFRFFVAFVRRQRRFLGTSSPDAGKRNTVLLSILAIFPICPEISSHNCPRESTAYVLHWRVVRHLAPLQSPYPS